MRVQVQCLSTEIYTSTFRRSFILPGLAFSALGHRQREICRGCKRHLDLEKVPYDQYYVKTSMSLNATHIIPILGQG